MLGGPPSQGPPGGGPPPRPRPEAAGPGDGVRGTQERRERRVERGRQGDRRGGRRRTWITGRYEVLRARLAGTAAELARRAEALNARRQEVFGGAELRLAGTERIRTGHNCVPAATSSPSAGVMLFGYNVFLGLKPETTVGDVFSLHRFDAGRATASRSSDRAGAVPGLLDDPHFAARLRRPVPLLPAGPAAAAAPRGRPAARGVPDRRDAARHPGAALAHRPRTAASPTSTTSGERDHAFPPPARLRVDRDHARRPRPRPAPARLHPGRGVRRDRRRRRSPSRSRTTPTTGEGIYAEPVDEPLQSPRRRRDRRTRGVGRADPAADPARTARPRGATSSSTPAPAGRARSTASARAAAAARGPGHHLPRRLLPDAGDAQDVRHATSTGLEFERVVRSPNGEDVLYVFHAPRRGPHAAAARTT